MANSGIRKIADLPHTCVSVGLRLTEKIKGFTEQCAHCVTLTNDYTQYFFLADIRVPLWCINSFFSLKKHHKSVLLELISKSSRCSLVSRACRQNTILACQDPLRDYSRFQPVRKPSLVTGNLLTRDDSLEGALTSI